MRRTKQEWVAVCHWDKTTPVKGSTYRTPLEGVAAVGWKVCTPGCPDRPADATCYRQGELHA
jgi:hypothetical protein